MRKILFSFFCLFSWFLADQVLAASPTPLGGVSFTKQTPSGTSFTISYTVTAGNNIGLVVVGTTTGGSNTGPTGITYNGTALTQLLNLTGSQRGNDEMWFLANPSTGANNLVLTYAANQTPFVGVFELQDVAQSSPVDVSNKANVASPSSALSVSVTPTVGNTFVVAWLDEASVAPTADVGQTVIGATNDGTDYFASSYKVQGDTPSAVSLGYTWTGGDGADIYIAALKYVAPPVSVDGIGGKMSTFFLFF